MDGAPQGPSGQLPPTQAQVTRSPSRTFANRRAVTVQVEPSLATSVAGSCLTATRLRLTPPIVEGSFASLPGKRG
jgi:hypothetical protein